MLLPEIVWYQEAAKYVLFLSRRMLHFLQVIMVNRYTYKAIYTWWSLLNTELSLFMICNLTTYHFNLDISNIIKYCLVSCILDMLPVQLFPATKFNGTSLYTSTSYDIDYWIAVRHFQVRKYQICPFPLV